MADEVGTGGTGLLEGLTVVDLAGETPAYAGRVFAELGAEVILVEPPGGSPLRLTPPIVEVAGARVSAFFAAMAIGKRSLVVDHTSEAGRDLLGRLVARADVVLLPSDPELPGRWQVDPATVRSMNQRAVVVSVTPFGLSGPRRRWRGSDLVSWASSGVAFMMGDPDRPPIAPGGGLGHSVSSLNAVAGAMLALRARRRTGRGQLVDISMQEGVLSVSMEAGPLHALEGRQPQRVGRQRMPGLGVFEARDGLVDLAAFLPTQWDALAEWISDELGGEEAKLDVFRGSIMTRVPFTEAINAWVSELAARYTKQEFFLEAQRRGVPCGPINTSADLLDDVQLKATGAWQPAPHPDVEGFSMPRGPVAVSGRVSPVGPVPRIGEHTGPVLTTILGLTADEVAALERQGTVQAGPGPAPGT